MVESNSHYPTDQNPDKQATQQQAIRDAHQAYLGLCTALFPTLSACSFDKGFHSPANQRELTERLDRVVLPKKGRWSQADTTRETDPAFVQARRQHSAVESGINALEVHALDYCPDRGWSASSVMWRWRWWAGTCKRSEPFYKPGRWTPC